MTKSLKPKFRKFNEGCLIRAIFTHESQTGLRAFVLIMIAITLMIMDKRLGSLQSIRFILSGAIAPFQYVVNWPNKLIQDTKNIVRSHFNLIQENLQLKQNQLLFNSKLQRLEAIESENNYLKSLLKSTRHIKTKTLIAELLAVDPEPFVNRVILDQGYAHQKIYVGQPVLDAYGVMGQIMQVGPFSSRVLLINDPYSNLSVQNLRNGVRAIAVGDAITDNIILKYVVKTADIKKGDIFVTSGLGDHFPYGYPVGQVLTVKKEPTHQFADITLKPKAHLDSSRQVLLVWYESNDHTS